MNRHKYSLLAALILSGLVHALFFIFSSDASLSNDVSHSSSVVIQLELLKSAEQVDVINRDVVISASDLSAHISSQLNDQQLVQPVNPSESIELEPDVKNESLAVMPSDEQSNESVHHEKLENNLNQLLELVYQEINREKRYPYLAKRQRREGLVKLSFVLHPDGQVTDVSVVESSRFKILDRAAQKAVEDISPFLLAADYLNYQRAFNVDVDFRLGGI